MPPAGKPEVSRFRHPEAGASGEIAFPSRSLGTRVKQQRQLTRVRSSKHQDVKENLTQRRKSTETQRESYHPHPNPPPSRGREFYSNTRFKVGGAPSRKTGSLKVPTSRSRSFGRNCVPKPELGNESETAETVDPGEKFKTPRRKRKPHAKAQRHRDTKRKLPPPPQPSPIKGEGVLFKYKVQSGGCPQQENRKSQGSDIPKQELRAKLRSQAGAWERE